MTLPAALSGFVLLILLRHVVQSQSGWGVTYSPDKVCAVEGATVELRCTYTYPYSRYYRVTKSFWFIRERYGEPLDLKDDPQYANRVTYSDGNLCRVRITNVGKSDSAVYKFRFITNKHDGRYTGAGGVTLSVTDLWVRTSWRSTSKWVTLMCVSSCPAPQPASYIWYKDGQKISATTNSHTDHYDHSYSCALKDFESFPSPPACGRYSQCNTVTYTDRTICAPLGSSVDISCTHNRYQGITSKFWFSPERSDRWFNRERPEDLSKDPQYAGRVQVSDDESGRYILKITNLTKSDSAEYRFKFRTWDREWGNDLHGTTLTVTDPDLRVQASWSSYSQSQTLTCVSSCPVPQPASYIWYKDGQKISATTYSHTDHYDHSYSCALKDFESFPSAPTCGRESLCNTVTYADRTICAPLGSSVDISCTHDRYQRITSKLWFSPERRNRWINRKRPEDLSEDFQYAGRVQVSDDQRGRYTLKITNLSKSDSAEYCFKFRTKNREWGNDLHGTTLTVTDLQVQVKRIKAYQSFTEAELKCHSTCNEAERLSYIWFMNTERILGAVKSTYRNSFSHEDKISCALHGHERSPSPSVYAPKTTSVLLNASAVILENSFVTLTCSTDANPAANFTWFKKNESGDFQPFSNEEQLVFSSVQLSDAGEYRCSAENEFSQKTSNPAIIDVKYAPKFLSVSLSPSGIIIEGGSVTLNCRSDANPPATYTWYKMDQTAPRRLQGLHHFSTISSEDRGTYYCTSKNDYGQINSSPVFIDVQYAPKIPAVSVSPVGKITEGHPVTLTCKSDANPAASITWYKDNQTLPQGQKDIYHFTAVRSEDSGVYFCKTANPYGQKSSERLNLDVQYSPRRPNVSQSPSAEIMEGSTVVLNCSSDANPAANYTWYKSIIDTPVASGQIFTIRDIKLEHRGSYYCQAHNSIGHKNSALNSVVVVASMKSAVAGSVTAVILVLIFILIIFLYVRKKRSSKETNTPRERGDIPRQVNKSSVSENSSDSTRRQPTDEQDLFYASVRFVKNQDDPIYSNVVKAKSDRPKNKEEEDEYDVEYSVVNFKCGGATSESRYQAALEDASALYSAVGRKPRV